VLHSQLQGIRRDSIYFQVTTYRGLIPSYLSYQLLLSPETLVWTRPCVFLFSLFFLLFYNYINFRETPRRPPPAPNTNLQHQPPLQRPSKLRPLFPARRLTLLPPSTIPKPGLTSPSPSPFPRSGHALPATSSKGDLFLFSANLQKMTFMHSPLSQTRPVVQTTGTPAVPRIGHACALVATVIIVWVRYK
jgi:hypothetical protein